MRQLLLQAPRGYGTRILSVANQHEARNFACLSATDGTQAIDLVLADLPNHRIEAFLADLRQIPELHVTLDPHGVLSLAPPATKASQQVIDVTPRSPFEIVLSGIQSVGSWRGFLGFAVAAGVVAWIGLYTDTLFLLTASMLIAPFASPAMNLAIATARGDGTLMLRSLGRYAGALAIAILTAALLSVLMRQQTVTAQMTALSHLSSSAVLLPLVAGAAGALSQVLSERSSLISGAAVGMLVAASLAPPGALIGMAIAMGTWDLAKVGLYMIVLQLLGINLAGSLVFRLYGLAPGRAPDSRERPALTVFSLSATLLGLMGMLAWQVSSPPEFQQDTYSRKASTLIQQTVHSSGLAELVEVNVRFPRRQSENRSLILCEVYLRGRSDLSKDVISQRLGEMLQQRLDEAGFQAEPLIDVTVLEASR